MTCLSTMIGRTFARMFAHAPLCGGVFGSRLWCDSVVTVARLSLSSPQRVFSWRGESLVVVPGSVRHTMSRWKVCGQCVWRFPTATTTHTTHTRATMALTRLESLRLLQTPTRLPTTPENSAHDNSLPLTRNNARCVLSPAQVDKLSTCAID